MKRVGDALNGTAKRRRSDSPEEGELADDANSVKTKSTRAKESAARPDEATASEPAHPALASSAAGAGFGFSIKGRAAVRPPQLASSAKVLEGMNAAAKPKKTLPFKSKTASTVTAAPAPSAADPRDSAKTPPVVLPPGRVERPAGTVAVSPPTPPLPEKAADGDYISVASSVPSSKLDDRPVRARDRSPADSVSGRRPSYEKADDSRSSSRRYSRSPPRARERRPSRDEREELRERDDRRGARERRDAHAAGRDRDDDHDRYRRAPYDDDLRAPDRRYEDERDSRSRGGRYYDDDRYAARYASPSPRYTYPSRGAYDSRYDHRYHPRSPEPYAYHRREDPYDGQRRAAPTYERKSYERRRSRSPRPRSRSRSPPRGHRKPGEKRVASVPRTRSPTPPPPPPPVVRKSVVFPANLPPPPPIISSKEPFLMPNESMPSAPRDEIAESKPAPPRRFFGCSDISCYETKKQIGEGTFGVVTMARVKVEPPRPMDDDRPRARLNQVVALKKILFHNENDGMPITALREIRLLKALSHPNVVPVLDIAYKSGDAATLKRGETFMVFPYMDHDLAGLLENPTVKLALPVIKLYARQLLEGTHYLHANAILHRDLKAANLLINNKGVLMIADFGLARPLDLHDPSRRYTGQVVTRWYRPPELCLGQRVYSTPVDMWGVGCIIAEMFTRKPIFPGQSDQDQLEQIFKICGAPTDEKMPGWRNLPGSKDLTHWDPYPPCIYTHFPRIADFGPDGHACLELLDGLLQLDAARRLSAREALMHPWFFNNPLPASPENVPTFPTSHEADARQNAAQRAQARPAAPMINAGTAWHAPPPQAMPAYGRPPYPQNYALGANPYAYNPYQGVPPTHLPPHPGYNQPMYTGPPHHGYPQQNGYPPNHQSAYGPAPASLPHGPPDPRSARDDGLLPPARRRAPPPPQTAAPAQPPPPPIDVPRTSRNDPRHQRDDDVAASVHDGRGPRAEQLEY